MCEATIKGTIIAPIKAQHEINVAMKPYLIKRKHGRALWRVGWNEFTALMWNDIDGGIRVRQTTGGRCVERADCDAAHPMYTVWYDPNPERVVKSIRADHKEEYERMRAMFPESADDE